MCHEGGPSQRHRAGKIQSIKGLKISGFSCFGFEADKTILTDSNNTKIYCSFLKKYHSYYILSSLME